MGRHTNLGETGRALKRVRTALLYDGGLVLTIIDVFQRYQTFQISQVFNFGLLKNFLAFNLAKVYNHGTNIRILYDPVIGRR